MMTFDAEIIREEMMEDLGVETWDAVIEELGKEEAERELKLRLSCLA